MATNPARTWGAENGAFCHEKFDPGIEYIISIDWRLVSMSCTRCDRELDTCEILSAADAIHGCLTDADEFIVRTAVGGIYDGNKFICFSLRAYIARWCAQCTLFAERYSLILSITRTMNEIIKLYLFLQIEGSHQARAGEQKTIAIELFDDFPLRVL